MLQTCNEARQHLYDPTLCRIIPRACTVNRSGGVAAHIQSTWAIVLLPRTIDAPAPHCHFDLAAAAVNDQPWLWRPPPQADTDLLSDRRARMDEWQKWADSRKEWRKSQAKARDAIILARYPQANEPDTFTTEQAHPLPPATRASAL